MKLENVWGLMYSARHRARRKPIIIYAEGRTLLHE
jgi:hypothetical protein